MDSEKPMFGGALKPTWPSLLLLLTVVLLLSYQISTIAGSSTSGLFNGGGGRAPLRKTVMTIRDFGGVGDGETSNTAALREAIRFMQEKGGGAQLDVPEGRWLTGSFNLTSNFTLFLHRGAVILASHAIIEPLLSYGRGRERLGGRHISLIHGDGLTDVVITGHCYHPLNFVDMSFIHEEVAKHVRLYSLDPLCLGISGHNGTIDGQGKMWWEQWWNRTLDYTRGHLLELMNSNNILISNLTFVNSPFWTVHPVYCSNVVIKNMTVLAPLKAPNTDGIDADSCTNVCIEDCYIESGDDLIAIKSGWDQYGIKMARPSSNIIVRRVSGTTPTCSGIGIGSEMSGGVSNVTIEDIHVWNSAAGVRIKSDNGRGGYIENVTIRNIKMERVKAPIKFSRGSHDHPDEGWDPKAVPKVKGIFISNILSLNSSKAPVLLGVEGSSYEGICLKNVTLLGVAASAAWQCEFVSGFSTDVFPTPCPQLQDIGSSDWCQQH